MNKHADLHIHTHFSDSTSSPEEVIEQAYQNQLSAIAIADHDTVDGICPTIEAAKKYDIEVISAVELSTEYNGKDVHMLGYLFDYTDIALLKKISMMQDTRVERMEEMIDKLKALGIDNISLEEVCSLAESKSVGRPHLAHVLVEKGWVKTIKQAFDKYLAEGKPGYVPKFKQSPMEAIKIIHDAGGIISMAHPMATRMDEIIPELVRSGMDAIEVYYPNTPKNIIEFYEGIAKKHNLLMTGGSDAHGDAKKHTYVGKMKVSYDLVEKMKEAAGKYKVVMAKE